MITINKGLIAGAALIAVGLVAAVDMAQSRTGQTAAATVEARFPAVSEMMVTLAAPTPTGCTREHWPYIADECLSGSDKAKRPTRTIPLERQVVAEAHVR